MSYSMLVNLGIPSLQNIHSSVLGSGVKISTSSSLLVAWDIEHHPGAGDLASPRNPPPQPRATNVILFGETGVEKVSIINLITQRDVARVPSDANCCTMEYTPYQTSFNDMNCTIFDAIGLQKPEMGLNSYLKAIKKVFDLITALEAAGGVHLLLFCMHVGRIAATTQSNYRMFYECLCHKKVPIVLIFTGFERKVDIDDWWRRNEHSLIMPYDFKSCDHACITVVHDGTPEGSDKYNQSQEKIRDLIKTCSLESSAPLPEMHSLFAKFAKEMMSFIKKRSDPGRKKFLKVLTQHCRLAPDVAEKIVNMMEKGDLEPNEDETRQPGDDKNQSESSLSAAAITNMESSTAGNAQQHGTTLDNQDPIPPYPFTGAMAMPTEKTGEIEVGSNSAAGTVQIGKRTQADVSREDGPLNRLGPPFSGTPPSLPQPRIINVILFGETGIAKSSVINLIARKTIVEVSSDVNGCTMESTPHQISFDGMNFTIFDTRGLEEPEMEVNGYLKAIEKAFDLITRLEAAGGVHLLLFCIPSGRMTATTQSNYRMFYECLCRREVPIALVFTGLEREVDMDDWWRRNESHIVHYGIKSHGHACITAVHDGTPKGSDKYNQSQKKIRDLIKSCSLESPAPLPEPHSWFAKFAKGMTSFIKKRPVPERNRLLEVLTQRCHLAPDVAEKIIYVMEKSDPEDEDGANPSEEVAEKRDNLSSDRGDTESVKHLVVAAPKRSLMSRSLNIILFGETGVGKSSVINLIAGKELAQTSEGPDGCTMSFTSYTFDVSGRTFHIWDTVGLNEPEMGVNGYLNAILQACELIRSLESKGGVDLLLFCIRKGRVTATTLNNYRLFYEGLCRSRVPIALVITHLELETRMEDWWEKYANTLIEKYGLTVVGHACVTGLPDHPKYEEAKANINKLLQGHHADRFTMSPQSWYIEFFRMFGRFVPLEKEWNRRDIMKVLKRCQLDSTSAELVAKGLGMSRPHWFWVR